jgi:hypothetical protein
LSQIVLAYDGLAACLEKNIKWVEQESRLSKLQSQIDGLVSAAAKNVNRPAPYANGSEKDWKGWSAKKTTTGSAKSWSDPAKNWTDTVSHLPCLAFQANNCKFDDKSCKFNHTLFTVDSFTDYVKRMTRKGRAPMGIPRHLQDSPELQKLMSEVSASSESTSSSSSSASNEVAQ